MSKSAINGQMHHLTVVKWKLIIYLKLLSLYTTATHSPVKKLGAVNHMMDISILGLLNMLLFALMTASLNLRFFTYEVYCEQPGLPTTLLCCLDHAWSALPDFIVSPLCLCFICSSSGIFRRHFVSPIYDSPFSHGTW